MLFRDSRVKKHLFEIDEIPNIKTNSVFDFEISDNDRKINLEIFINFKEKAKNRLIAYGYFLDETQWYLVDFLFVNEKGRKSIVTLSPKTAPNYMNDRLVEYYEKRIKRIPDVLDNLA